MNSSTSLPSPCSSSSCGMRLFQQLSPLYAPYWQDLSKRLTASPFRSRFRLKGKDARILPKKGNDRILLETEQILTQRIADAFPFKDGRQTPMRGYPIFIAQHACGICCRSCLEKWHHIPKGRPLTRAEIEKLSWCITAWIEEHSSFEEEKGEFYTPELF